MPETPTYGSMVQPDKICRLIAMTAKWQEVITAAGGTGNTAQEAFDNHCWYPQAPGSAPYPRVIATVPGDRTEEKIGLATWVCRGTTELLFELEVPDTETTDQDRFVWFENRIGEIWVQARTLADASQALLGDVNPIELVGRSTSEGPWIEPPEERDYDNVVGTPGLVLIWKAEIWSW